MTACVNNSASLTVRNISIDKLPSILLIGKCRLAGRTACEVLSVIHGKASHIISFILFSPYFILSFYIKPFVSLLGNVGLDDLLSRLLEAVDMYTEQLQVEIAEEDARAARDKVKAEQDMAYQEALQADIAKEAAKRQKEAALVAERKRLESEKAEEEARRESIRLVVCISPSPLQSNNSLLIVICIPYFRPNNYCPTNHPKTMPTLQRYVFESQLVNLLRGGF